MRNRLCRLLCRIEPLSFALFALNGKCVGFNKILTALDYCRCCYFSSGFLAGFQDRCLKPLGHPSKLL